MTNETIAHISQKNLNPALLKIHKQSPVFTQGSMQYLYDSNNKRYLDFFGGIVTTSVGHCHQRLSKALSEQSKKLWHVSSLYFYEEIYEYALNLLSKFSSSLNNVIFCNSGSEANEIAILMARLFTGSNDIIALRNSYHGITSIPMSLCGIGSWKYPISQKSGVFHTSCPDPCRGRFGGSHCRDSLVQTKRPCNCLESECQACDNYIQDLEDVLNSSIPKSKVAALIAESIQGVGGVVQFPKEYLKKAQRLIKEKNGLVIIDEVQTGFGRLGSHFWGFESHGIVPDIGIVVIEIICLIKIFCLLF